MVYAVSTGAHRWGKMLKRLDNHLHKFHRGVTRGLNDNQPKRCVLEKSGKSRVTCLLPGCFKEVIHLSRHLRNVHSISVSEYCLMLGRKGSSKGNRKGSSKGNRKGSNKFKGNRKGSSKGKRKESSKGKRKERRKLHS